MTQTSLKHGQFTTLEYMTDILDTQLNENGFYKNNTSK